MAKKIENMAYLRSKYSNADTVDVKTIDLDLRTYIVINSVDKPHC